MSGVGLTAHACGWWAWVAVRCKYVCADGGCSLVPCAALEVAEHSLHLGDTDDSARFALIRMFSPVSASRDILWQVAHVDMMSRAASWYARVASASNPADGPSRLDFALVTQRWGAIRVYPELPDLSSSIRPE